MLTSFLALYGREVARFRKLWLDTIFSPIISVALYLSVFGIITGNQSVDGLPYVTFVYVGLVSMALINSSFANPAFALIIAKNVGTIVDLQLVPIRPWLVSLAFAFAAATRAVVTLLVTIALTAWFVPSMTILHPVIAFGMVIVTGLQFGLLGVSFGMPAKNFEALTFMTTFVLQPMIFLAGVFYPISQLPGVWSKVALFNPIHHTINLLRWSTTGYADVSPLISAAVAFGTLLVLLVTAQVTTKKCLHTNS